MQKGLIQKPPQIPTKHKGPVQPCGIELVNIGITGQSTLFPAPRILQLKTYQGYGGA